MRVPVALCVLALGSLAHAQPIDGGRCRPVTERTTEIGCWIVSHERVGRMEHGQVFWHLDGFSSAQDAERAKARGSVVVQALGKVWLLTVAPRGWRPQGGQRVDEIGPLPVQSGENYSAQYMETVFTPGMTSSTHVHSGPEAWYTQEGETCLETPSGVQVSAPGSAPVIVPDGPMRLTATGTTLRKGLVLILHLSDKAATTRVDHWTPKNPC
jgi:quercetin dioxygenase-like cupin family protein